MEQTPTTPPEEQPQNTPEPQPVAYDNEGRPLYAAPPTPPAQGSYNSEPGPQFVHLSRSVAPIQQVITPEQKAKHDDSLKKYPSLNISEAEFIISAVRRHPIGLVLPVTLTVILVAFIASMLINYPMIMNALSIYTPPPFDIILLVGLLLILLVLAGCYISVWIYRANTFYLTNESVVQEIQTGLFSHHEQTVSLANIEDASYQQRGILQLLFNYGSIRLSTEGEETTYRFSYVSNPKAQIATLNNAVEAFKNGRPTDN
jgi:uncharacterized membrane protein YdbT with pleckstrin-like domain